MLPLALQGRFDEAAAQAAIMWDAWTQAGRPTANWLGPVIYIMAMAHGLRGDDVGRRDWLARAGELVGTGLEKVSWPDLEATTAFAAARIALHEGRLDAAVASVAGIPLGAEPWYGTFHWHTMRPYAWAVAAEVAVAARLPDAAERLAAAAPAGNENYWASACLDRAAGRLRGDPDALARSVAGWERIDARFERACTLALLPGRAEEGLAELRALGCKPPAGVPGGR